MIGQGKSTRDPEFGPPTNPRRLNFYGHFRRSRRPARLRGIAAAAMRGHAPSTNAVVSAWRLFRRFLGAGA